MSEYNDRNDLEQKEAGDSSAQDFPGAEGRSPDNTDWSREESRDEYRDPEPAPVSQEPYFDEEQSPGGYGSVYPPSDRDLGDQPKWDAPRQEYGPYQYNANSGWQPPPPPREKYEWKFEDYEKLDRKRNGNRKQNRGLVVFTVSLLCILSAGLIGLAGYSIWSATAGSDYDDEYLEDGEDDGPFSGLKSEADENVSQLQINDHPDEASGSASSAASGGKLSIPDVAEAVLPSVVGVMKHDEELYYEISEYGSGIVMSDDGYIITNEHVVGDGVGVGYKVQFKDGDAYDATLVGRDPVTDLAVLKIDAEGLIPAQFGNSDQLRVGETVVAIGNPAGMELASSVTAGIISAINREVRTVNYQMIFIQTDAAINPGNSGGALANEYGQVIGINSAKILAEGYEGIGFAIPISTAKPIIDDIIQNGRVTGRVMLGITCKPVDEIDARNWDIKMGLRIDSVDPSSDLSEAGVLRHDILTHIDGERIYDLQDVRDILDQHKPGDTVTLTFYRKIGSKEQTYDVQTRLMESQ